MCQGAARELTRQPVAALHSVLIVDDDPDVVRTFAQTL